MKPVYFKMSIEQIINQIYQDVHYQLVVKATRVADLISQEISISDVKFQHYQTQINKMRFHDMKLKEFVEYKGHDVQYWMYLCLLVFCLLPDFENDPNIVDEFVTPDVLALASNMPDRGDLIDNKWIALLQSPDVNFYYCREHYSNLEFVDGEFDKLALPYSHICAQEIQQYADTERYFIIATYEDIPAGRNIRKIETTQQFVYVIKNMESCFYNENFCCMSHALFLYIE